MTEITAHGTGERGVFKLKTEEERRPVYGFLKRLRQRVAWRFFGRFVWRLKEGRRRIVRGIWRWESGKLVPYTKREAEQMAPFIKPDEVAPFRSHVDNRIYTSMSEYRKSLKRHGFVEKGNERAKPVADYKVDEREMRETVEKIANQIKWNELPETEWEREQWKREERRQKRN